MKKYSILIVALVLGSFLRLWQISDVPNGLTWDEAAIGYNAYSILKTGRDEHGAFLPIIFKSFGDYKPGAYIYLTVPSVAIFGLNEFAVRFPSALAGIIGILGIYLLTKEIIEKKQELVSQLSALAFAISPWSVHFGRGAWEVNVFASFTVFSLYFFLKFLKKKSSIFPSLTLACLSLAVYQAAKLLTPLLFLFLVVLYKDEFMVGVRSLLKTKKILYLIPIVLFGVWIYFGAIFGSAGNRLSTLSIFNYRPKIVSDNSLFHNQFLLTTSLVISRYLYYFSPEVLFYEGTAVSERAHIPGSGLLSPIEFLFLGAGLFYLLKYGSQKVKTLLFGLVFISPIPASLTLAEYSPLRSLFMVYPLSIISGLGIHLLIKKLRYFCIPAFLFYSAISVYVFDLYFFHSQNTFYREFNYGYKQTVQIINENPTKKVVFTDVFGQPYIYYLFYTKYDPATYQKNNGFVDGGLDVGKVNKIANVEFRQFDSNEILNSKDTLFIGSEGNINNQFDIAGSNVGLFRQFQTPDQHILFRAIKTKP